MAIFKIRKPYLILLFAIVLPGTFVLIKPELDKNKPHSTLHIIEKNGSLKFEEICQRTGDFDDFLDEVNKRNKERNIVCGFAQDLTTTSKLVVCSVVNGRMMGQFYWSENLKECLRLYEAIKEN